MPRIVGRVMDCIGLGKRRAEHEEHPQQESQHGGADTVRGQPYQSLNISQGGITTGGLSFLGVSLETRISITDTIGVVVFGDAGYVGTTSVPGQNGSSHSGAGLGLRYDTGVGPIRFDVAAPVTGTTGNGVQFYIGIGQAF